MPDTVPSWPSVYGRDMPFLRHPLHLSEGPRHLYGEIHLHHCREDELTGISSCSPPRLFQLCAGVALSAGKAERAEPSVIEPIELATGALRLTLHGRAPGAKQESCRRACVTPDPTGWRRCLLIGGVASQPECPQTRSLFSHREQFGLVLGHCLRPARNRCSFLNRASARRCASSKLVLNVKTPE